MVRIRFRKKKINPVEASMLIDKPEIKVVEARYKNMPFLIGVGTSTSRGVKGRGELGTEGVRGEYQERKDLDWQLLYSPKTLPDFIPFEKLKDFMSSTVSVVSGSIDVFDRNTRFIETEQEKLENIKKKEEIIEEMISTDFFDLKGDYKRKKKAFAKEKG